MNFDNWQDRIEEIKNNVHRMNCTIGSEGDREGYYYELIDTDYEWLFAFIEAQRKLIESYGRVTEGMVEDYQRLEKINKELNEFKTNAETLFQRQKLGFKKQRESIEQLEADRDYWKSKCLLLQKQ